LEKGGYFNVEQRELSPGEWDLTLMEVNMKSKALLFKTIALEEKDRCSDFRTVPDSLALAEAADMLTKQIIVAAYQWLLKDQAAQSPLRKSYSSRSLSASNRAIAP
jgi:hypothetical protein